MSTSTAVLVLKGCGPKGYPGMPEVGNFGLPKSVLAKGIRDMVRISDARMSGTAFGTVVLHTAPEAAAGGPLAVVRRTATSSALDVPNRSLDPRRSTTRSCRTRGWLCGPGPSPAYDRGYYRLYINSVLQADQGCDFDFLVGKSTDRVARDAH